MIAARRYMPVLNHPDYTQMTGSTLSSAELDYRRRKLLFRSWHRGMREVDLVLGNFADAELATLDEAELAIYEALMGEPDGDILKWVTGEVPVPPRHDTPLFGRLRTYGSVPGEQP